MARAGRSGKGVMVATLALGAAGLFGACGDSGVLEPNLPREEVVGTYEVASLVFDPTGSIGPVDVVARLEALGKPRPQMTLLDDGRLQLLFEEPGSRALRLVEGTFRTTPDAVRVDLGGGTAYRLLLLSRVLTLEVRDDGSLGFQGEAPDGAPLPALRALAPELEGEPLTDPVPGTLTLVLEAGL